MAHPPTTKKLYRILRLVEDQRNVAARVYEHLTHTDAYQHSHVPVVKVS